MFYKTNELQAGLRKIDEESQISARALSKHTQSPCKVSYNKFVIAV